MAIGSDQEYQALSPRTQQWAVTKHGVPYHHSLLLDACLATDFQYAYSSTDPSDPDWAEKLDLAKWPIAKPELDQMVSVLSTEMARLDQLWQEYPSYPPE